MERRIARVVASSLGRFAASVAAAAPALLLLLLRMRSNGFDPVPLRRAIAEGYRRRLANHGREPERPRSFFGHVARKRYLVCIFPQWAHHKLQTP
jgi:hypothetical protein